MIRKTHLFVCLFALAACAGESETSAATPSAPATAAETSAQAPAPEQTMPFKRYGIEIVATYPHDPGAFTQGLFWQDGHLYEGTGRHGQSSLRKVVLETGEVIQRHDIPRAYFGEGIAPWGDHIVGLTWRSGTGFVYGQDDFSVDGEFSYNGEGWGLTASDTHLVMSDGTDVLRFLDPETFEVERRLNVTINGEPLVYLNELEWVDGEIFANIWQTNAIARIDPNTGKVTGIVNLTGLSQQAGIGPSNDRVLNGIAWDGENERLFVTGKNWPKLFEIRLVETAPRAN